MIELPSFGISASFKILISRNLDQEALAIINRPQMLQFLMSLKRSDGSFSLHDRGETDSRGSMPYILYMYVLINLIFIRQAIVQSQLPTCADWLTLRVFLIVAASGCLHAKHLRVVLAANPAAKRMYGTPLCEKFSVFCCCQSSHSDGF